ncbi:hypothetical protein JVU11DRAFT_4093 [Chiua virens]|nr:hypothetical protein JVU11DRAFT_4093 [Chiua virens]
MFITNCCKSLTLHDFTTPPATVLDLGCGRGLWAIEAARQWQGSTVVGFDVQSVQPKLRILDKNLSRRLKWVHGNLLDGLPFLDGQFDFVRMVRMGLHIPEDEVSAVKLLPIPWLMNCLSKIIEEDLIFPSPRAPDTSVASSPLSENSSPRSSNTAVSNQNASKSDPFDHKAQLKEQPIRTVVRFVFVVTFVGSQIPIPSRPSGSFQAQTRVGRNVERQLPRAEPPLRFAISFRIMVSRDPNSPPTRGPSSTKLVVQTKYAACYGTVRPH